MWYSRSVILTLNSLQVSPPPPTMVENPGIRLDCFLLFNTIFPPCNEKEHSEEWANLCTAFDEICQKPYSYLMFPYPYHAMRYAPVSCFWAMCVHMCEEMGRDLVCHLDPVQWYPEQVRADFWGRGSLAGWGFPIIGSPIPPAPLLVSLIVNGWGSHGMGPTLARTCE